MNKLYGYAFGPYPEDLVQLLEPRQIFLKRGPETPSLSDLRKVHFCIAFAYSLPKEQNEVLAQYSNEDGRIIYNFNLRNKRDGIKKSEIYREVGLNVEFTPIDTFEIQSEKPIILQSKSGDRKETLSIKAPREDMKIVTKVNYKQLSFPYPLQSQINIGDLDRNDGLTSIVNFDPVKTRVMILRQISRAYDFPIFYKIPEYVDLSGLELPLTDASLDAIWKTFYNFKKTYVAAILMDNIAAFCQTMFENHAAENIEFIDKFVRHFIIGRDVSTEDMPTQQQAAEKSPQTKQQREKIVPFDVYGDKTDFIENFNKQ